MNVKPNKTVRDVAAEEIPFAAIVEAGGGVYVGIQDTFNETPSLVLFNDSHGSTLALSLADCSAASVRQAIGASNKRYGCIVSR